MKRLWEQIWKFGIVGGLSFLVDLFVFKWLSQGLMIHYLLANFTSFIVSVTFNYILSMKYVFVRRDNADKHKEFIFFLVLSAFGLLLNEGIIFLCIDGIYLKSNSLMQLAGRDRAELFGKIIATGIVMVYNFITRKIFIDKK